MKNAKTLLFTLIFFSMSIYAVSAENTYSILFVTGRGYIVASAAMQPDRLLRLRSIQAAIDVIKNHANGQDCTIHFGDIKAGTVLNIGDGNTTLITFNGNWGNITLKGKATTESTSNAIILIENGVSVNCKADLTATSTSTSPATGTLFYNKSGILNISGGTISTKKTAISTYSDGKTKVSGTAKIVHEGTSPNILHLINLLGDTNTDCRLEITGGIIEKTSPSNGYAIFNNSTAEVKITGGTIAGQGIAINNYSTGTININGGIIESIDGNGITNYKTGKIIVSGNALIRSLNSHAIYFLNLNNDTATNWRLKMTGGTVESASLSDNNCAISNPSPGALEISGGMILSETGDAIHSIGATLISGGIMLSKSSRAVFSSNLSISGNSILFSYGTAVTDVIRCYNCTQSGNSVIAAWNKAAGITQYMSNTNTDIFKLPESATAVWTKEDDISGISITNDANTGFIPIEYVNVSF